MGICFRRINLQSFSYVALLSCNTNTYHKEFEKSRENSCNLHYEQFPDGTVKCIEDEIPFDVPDGWAWCRFSSAFIINPRNQLSDDMSVSFVPMPLIQEGYVNKHTDEEKIWGSVKSGFTHFANNDVGVAKITPCFENKKSVVFKGLKNGYGAGTTELHIIRTIDNLIYPEYVLWNVKTDNFISNGIKAFSGAVGQKRIGKDFIEKSLIPIAPTNEQKRILECISIAFEYIDSIEASKEAFKVDIQSIKSKILDLAIRGKLVPQNPDDEPASILLERIRAEKEDLIKQSKIKRDKKDSFIFKGEDNSYYQALPKFWSCCYLSEVSIFERGITFPASAKEALATAGNIACARTANVQETFDVNDLIYVDKAFMKNNANKLLRIDDIIISTANSFELVGKSCIVNKLDEEMTFGGFVTVIRGIIIDCRYLHLCLKSKFLKGEFSHKSTQTTNIANITSDDLSKTIINLPPHAEQKRIVEAIETVFSQLDEILNSI